MNKRVRVIDRRDLMDQWDFEKNTADPAHLTVGSGQRAWWICDKGHSWEAEVKGRVRGTGCPYCAGKKALLGFNDLETCRPKLAEEWDYEKNRLTPSQVTFGSKKRVWWICDTGHSWEATIGSRSNGSGCPVCVGRTAFAGHNDLHTLRPDLAQEWNYDKNKVPPSQFTVGSSKAVWWLCEKRHSWKTSIANRSNKKTGTGCPYCAGKVAIPGVNDLQTLNTRLAAEWDFEKNEILPSDVTLRSNKEAWWICGKGHSWKATVDTRSVGRGCPYCAGKRVLEGFNDLQTLNSKLAREWDYDKNKLLPTQVTTGSGKMVWWICEKGHSWEAKVLHRNYGSGCPHCSKHYERRTLNKLRPLSGQLIDEWDYEKNKRIPSQVTSGSDQYAWWKCAKGHSWRAKIQRRSNGAKCPYCLGRRVFSGFNDLQTLNPMLAQEWDWGMNRLTPDQVLIGSTKPVWWKCAKGHSWQCSVTKRHSAGYGCPYCSGQRVLEGFNDLLTCNPELADEWDYDKNDLLPTQITLGSDKKVWWKCKKGHSWEAVIKSRKIGRGCPYCIGQFPYTPRCVK